jgi:hypothetical protein
MKNTELGLYTDQRSGVAIEIQVLLLKSSVTMKNYLKLSVLLLAKCWY